MLRSWPGPQEALCANCEIILQVPEDPPVCSVCAPSSKPPRFRRGQECCLLAKLTLKKPCASPQADTHFSTHFGLLSGKLQRKGVCLQCRLMNSPTTPGNQRFRPKPCRAPPSSTCCWWRLKQFAKVNMAPPQRCSSVKMTSGCP